MSRTYRNRRYRQYFTDATDSGILTEHWVSEYDPESVENVKICFIFPDGDERYNIRYKRNSKEGKKRLAKYFSDAGTHNFKEPGPSWFRNLYFTRPDRRAAKREIQKYLADDDYEVITCPKVYLPYWT